MRKKKSYDLDDLCQGLMACFKEARKVLANNCLSGNQATALAKYVETIRLLLRDLEQAAHSLINAEDEASAISKLRDNYRDLEGMVKELRNDLNRTCPSK